MTPGRYSRWPSVNILNANGALLAALSDTAWMPLYRQARVGEVRFHNLRHAAATTLLAEGTDVATVAGRLGHASPVTTMRVYAHVLEARDRKAAGVMGALLTAKNAA